MLSLLTVFALHVPPEMYLRCEDLTWLKEGLDETDIFTPSQKADIYINWLNHTDPKCFDN